MCACVCVCVCVCVRVRVRVHACIHVHVFACVRVRVCIHTCTYACIYACMYMFIYAYICAYVCMSLCVYVICMYSADQTQVNSCMRVYLESRAGALRAHFVTDMTRVRVCTSTHVSVFEHTRERVYKTLRRSEQIKFIDNTMAENDELMGRQMRELLHEKWPNLDVTISTIKRARPKYCLLVRAVNMEKKTKLVQTANFSKRNI